MRALIYTTTVVWVIALALLGWLHTVPLFTKSPIEFCGREHVYRPCPWNPKPAPQGEVK